MIITAIRFSKGNQIATVFRFFSLNKGLIVILIVILSVFLILFSFLFFWGDTKLHQTTIYIDRAVG